MGRGEVEEWERSGRGVGERSGGDEWERRVGEMSG